MAFDYPNYTSPCISIKVYTYLYVLCRYMFFRYENIVYGYSFTLFLLFKGIIYEGRLKSTEPHHVVKALQWI